MSFSIRKTKRNSIYDRDHHCCVYCSKPVIAGGRSGLHNSATLDHIKPQSKGGSNSAKNLVTCCWTCNSSKCDATFVVFAQRLGARTGQDIDSRDLYGVAVKHSRRSIARHLARRKAEASAS